MSFEQKFAKFNFGLTPRVKMYRRLSAFVSQGVPLYKVIEKLEALYKNRSKGDPRAVILSDWRQKMEEGASLAQAMSAWVPPAEVMLIESGEASGNLPDAFDQAIYVTQASQKMRSAVIGGLAYSVITLLVLFGLIYMFAKDVIPMLSDIIPPDTWPSNAKSLYDMSQFVLDYGLYCMGGFIGLSVVASKSLGAYTGRSRSFLDKLPPWSIYKSFQSAVFLVALSSMMRSGVTLKNSLSKLRGYSSPYMSMHLSKMIRSLGTGASNGKALDSGLLARDIADDIILYGEVANFEQAMSSIGDEAISEGVANITTISSIIGTVILILTGVYTGWVYFAFFSLTSSIADTAS